MSNIDKLIVLNLLELPRAIDKIGDASRRAQALDAVRSEIRNALEEGRTTLEKSQKQLEMTEQNYQAALEAVQKQELELIKLRQRDASASELSEASRVLDPLKEALGRLKEQRGNLQEEVAPLRREVEALSDKMAQLNNFSSGAPSGATSSPKSARSETKTTESRSSEAKSSDTKSNQAKTGEQNRPNRPQWPEGDYNPFSVLDYLTGKIEEEELLAGINGRELKAYFAQREIDQLAEDAEIAERLKELKKRLGKE